MNSIVVGPNLEIVLSSEERKKFELGKSKLKFGVRECVDLGELEKSVLSEIRIAEVEHELLSGLHFAFLVGLSADGGGGGRARTSSSESGGGAHREIRREISHVSQFYSDSTSVQYWNGRKIWKKAGKYVSEVRFKKSKVALRCCYTCLAFFFRTVLEQSRMSPLVHVKKRTEEMVAAAPHSVGSGEGVAGHRHREKNRGYGRRRTSSLLRRIWRRTRRSLSSFIVAVVGEAYQSHLLAFLHDKAGNLASVQVKSLSTVEVPETHVVHLGLRPVRHVPGLPNVVQLRIVVDHGEVYGGIDGVITNLYKEPAFELSHI
nr:hypothetical protein Iba_chr03eCG1220 [Ipomoea batatas]